MNKQMIVRNNYHKALSFESVLGTPFSMEGYEVRTVDADIGLKLLKNVWVSEVGQEINPECLPYMEKIAIADTLPVPIVDILPEKTIEIPKEKTIEVKKVDKLNNEIK